MRLLALDTASEACSVALQAGDDVVERHVHAPRGHGGLLLNMVEEVLAEASLKPGDLDAIAFGRGPGSFTGVRIAAGAAQGLAFGVDVPVVTVSDLAMLAQGAGSGHTESVLACTDARMGEVYWGAFRRAADGVVVPLGEERLSAPGKVAVPGEGEWFGVGTGFREYGLLCDLTPAGCAGADLPRARDALPLALRDFAAGLAVAPELALPVYLRAAVLPPAGNLAVIDR